MKASLSSNAERGLTLLELFVILAVISVLAVLAIPVLLRARIRAQRIQCVSYLSQMGLACRIWEADHKDKYPMSVAGTNGGTMDFITGPDAWRHFQVMSNELSTPKVLICAADQSRISATNFDFISNSNISYFVGVDAKETNPQMILFGDRNITNGAAVKKGLSELTTNRLSGWTMEMHNGVGNIALADGSVQQLSTLSLRSAIANTGMATNRLQMPILGP